MAGRKVGARRLLGESPGGDAGELGKGRETGHRSAIVPGDTAPIRRRRLRSVRAVVQRVIRAEVSVDGGVVGAIGPGLVVLVGVTSGDTEKDAAVLATKLTGLRIFPDADVAMNRSVMDVGGSVLVVSQFTLYGDARRGRRPSFTAAAPPELAEPLVDKVAETIERAGVEVRTGRFGARMEVELVNDGPVTLILETSGGRLV